MTYRDTLRMLGIRLDPKQYRACTYLEQHGLRFCVDFGYQNAVEHARAHWRARRRARR